MFSKETERVYLKALELTVFFTAIIGVFAGSIKVFICCMLLAIYFQGNRIKKD